MGWSGTSEDLLRFLETQRADRDPAGNFLVAGGITSFMGCGEDYAIADDAVYFVDGVELPLAAKLAESGVGIAVTVI